MDPDVLEFLPCPARRSRILRLRESAHPKYEMCRIAFLYGCWTSIAAGVFGIPLFGLWWRHELWVWIAFAISMGVGLIVLGLSVFAAGIGCFTCWSLAAHETLRLDETEIMYTISRMSRRFWTGQPKDIFVWTLPYQNVVRLVYDRGQKCLRIYGRFREDGCRKPAPDSLPLPQGMLALPHPERRQDKDFFLEIPLYYQDSALLLKTLEERTGIFVCPAMRGDDYADLRDLPGLTPKLPVIRAFSLFLAVLCLSTIVLTAHLRRTETEPWQPYPLTEEAVLTGLFTLGDSVVLDGCRITLEKAEPGRDGGFLLSLLFVNENDISLLLHQGKQQSNILVFADTEIGRYPCNYIAPDNPLVQIAPGGAYHYDMLYSLPSGAETVIVEINSDRWAPRAHFWEPEYLGRPVMIDGEEYTHNQIRFEIPAK